MNARKRRILFIDRDGTLLVEPPDEQVDSLEKLELVPGVMPALLRLAEAGYEFVIVSNQYGLGTESSVRRVHSLSPCSAFGMPGCDPDAPSGGAATSLPLSGSRPRPCSYWTPSGRLY